MLGLRAAALLRFGWLYFTRFWFICPHSEFNATSNRQFRHGAGKAELHGTHADLQVLADIGVGPSPCHREEHLLALRQGLEGLPRLSYGVRS